MSHVFLICVDYARKRHNVWKKIIVLQTRGVMRRRRPSVCINFSFSRYISPSSEEAMRKHNPLSLSKETSGNV